MDMTNKHHNSENSFSRSVADGAALVEKDVHSRADSYAEGTPRAPLGEAWARRAASANGFGDAGIASQQSSLSRMAGRQC
jgi:hypothetical protein